MAACCGSRLRWARVRALRGAASRHVVAAQVSGRCRRRRATPPRKAAHRPPDGFGYRIRRTRDGRPALRTPIADDVADSGRRRPVPTPRRSSRRMDSVLYGPVPAAGAPRGRRRPGGAGRPAGKLDRRAPRDRRVPRPVAGVRLGPRDRTARSTARGDAAAAGRSVDRGARPRCSGPPTDAAGSGRREPRGRRAPPPVGAHPARGGQSTSRGVPGSRPVAGHRRPSACDRGRQSSHLPIQRVFAAEQGSRASQTAASTAARRGCVGRFSSLPASTSKKSVTDLAVGHSIQT